MRPRSQQAKPAAMATQAATDWLRAEWQAGRTRPIQERTGLVYHPPDLPLDVVGEEPTRKFLVQAARDWITANREDILARLTHRSAS